MLVHLADRPMIYNSDKYRLKILKRQLYGVTAFKSTPLKPIYSVFH